MSNERTRGGRLRNTFVATLLTDREIQTDSAEKFNRAAGSPWLNWKLLTTKLNQPQEDFTNIDEMWTNLLLNFIII